MQASVQNDRLSELLTHQRVTHPYERSNISCPQRLKHPSNDSAEQLEGPQRRFVHQSEKQTFAAATHSSSSAVRSCASPVPEDASFEVSLGTTRYYGISGPNADDLNWGAAPAPPIKIYYNIWLVRATSKPSEGVTGILVRAPNSH